MDTLVSLFDQLHAVNPAELFAAGGTAFALIAAAEIGDKSQLVCMTLASRHRPRRCCGER